MESKFIFVLVAVCLIQIFIDSALAIDSSSKTKELNSAFAKHLSLSILSKNLKNSNPSVVVCYEKIQKEYEKALNAFSYGLKETAINFGQDVRLKYQEIGENAQKLAEGFSSLTALYPQKLESLVKNKNFTDAVQQIKNFKNSAQEFDSKISAEMDKIRSINSEDAKLAEEDYRSIRKEVKIKTEKISTKLEKCFEK